MYWYTSIKNSSKLVKLFSVGMASVLLSCNASMHETVTKDKHTYFDIPAYFNTQVSTLQAQNPAVAKTVIVNKEKEHKEVHIEKWDAELLPFLNIDLNKEAYQQYIVKDSTDNTVTYSLSNKDLDLNKVIITYEGQVPSAIEIEKTTANFLYHTVEKLHFNKDKSYRIAKTQKVILVGENEYIIEGKIL